LRHGRVFFKLLSRSHLWSLLDIQFWWCRIDYNHYYNPTPDTFLR